MNWQERTELLLGEEKLGRLKKSNVLVVGLGLVIPAILEFLELKKYKIPVLIPAIMVIMGGLIFRFIIAFAGQESRWLY